MILKVFLIVWFATICTSSALSYERCLSMMKAQLCTKLYGKSQSGCLEMLQVDIHPDKVCLQNSDTNCVKILQMCASDMQQPDNSIEVSKILKVKQNKC